MSRTESTMLELGTHAPDFSLPDVITDNTVHRHQVAREKGLLVMFICAHCPYVKHIGKELAQLGTDYEEKPIGIVAISSNDAQNYPADAPDGLRKQAQRLGFVFPYLYDESQSVARAYDAACTPDFFLFDGDLRLVYRGQFDGSRPNSGIPVTGSDLRAALDAVLTGKPIAAEQRPSLGCNIKWKE